MKIRTKTIIFFPFTRMTGKQVRTMDLFFNGFKVLNLNPDSLLEPEFASVLESGRITPICVGDEDCAMLEAKVRSFKEWAAVHKGNEKNLKALIRENTYFRDETDVTAIQSGIRRGICPSSGKGEDVEMVTDPLLFLRFAEILDRENETIQGQLDALEQNNSALFAALKGEISPEDPILESNGHTDAGRPLNRIQERVEAWCTAAREISIFDGAGDCPVLATTSEAVFDYFTANFTPVINGLDIDSIKVHEHECDLRETRQLELYHALDEFILGKNPSWTEPFDGEECGCQTGRLRLCRFSGGVLNNRFNIPGTQVVVCLVKLNS